MEDQIANALLVIEDDEPYAHEKRIAITNAADAMRRNLCGYVRSSYNIHTDLFEWSFGSIVWNRLVDPVTGRPWKDDPLPHNCKEVRLTNFLVYLREWYHPRRQSAALD